MTPTVQLPPTAACGSVTEVLHGVEISDPYRWLEDQESEATRAWIQRQAAYTRLYLDSLAGRARIRSRIEGLLGAEVISDPRKVGDRYFYLKRKRSQQQSVIMMHDERSTAEEREVVLVDPAAKKPSGKTAVNILAISRDGQLMAYSVRESGRDAFAVEFLNVLKREVLRDGLPAGFCQGLVLSHAGDGFYYVHRSSGDSGPHRQAVYWHKFGTDRGEDREIFHAGDDPRTLVGISASDGGLLLGISVVSLSETRTVDFYVSNLVAGTTKKVVERMPGLFLPVFADDELVALTDWEAPNGRVVAIDIERPQPELWRDIVKQTASRIEDFRIAGQRIFIGSVVRGAMQVEIFDLAGHKRGVLPSPADGTARMLPCAPDSDVLFYKFSSFTHPPITLCYDTRSEKEQVWSASEISINPAGWNVEKTCYSSKDGTQVPIFLVSQNSRPKRRLPVFLTAYGGFGASMTPRFTAYATFLIEQGFLFALANIRGGSELGEEWHRAGKRRNRQNAIDDFISAAEWLLSNGLASPGRIAIGGGSNAGLLVGAALTQRPDLFRAALCLGPLLDMLRYHRFDLASDWIEEYGSADNEDDFRCLHAYSPYHNVEDGVRYPAVLLISGDSDTRCNPLHARKMCARLQAATSSGHPVLLDYKTNWGHVPVQSLDTRIDALTDRLAFICHELQVKV